MLTLYKFPPTGDLLSACPFCLKLEIYLKLAKVPYRSEVLRSARRSPTGKLPFITEGKQTIAGSSIIIDHLKSAYGDPLDKDLTPPQKAQALAMQRLVEEHLGWVIIYARWLDERSRPALMQALYGARPSLSQRIRIQRRCRHFKKALMIQGIGRYTQPEIYQMGFDDIDAIHRALGDKPFFFGDAPSSIDATLYAFLASILDYPGDSPLKQHINALGQINGQAAGLPEYCQSVLQY